MPRLLEQLLVHSLMVLLLDAQLLDLLHDGHLKPDRHHSTSPTEPFRSLCRQPLVGFAQLSASGLRGS